MGIFKRYGGVFGFGAVAISLGIIILLLTLIGFKSFQIFSLKANQLQVYRAMQRDAGKADSLSNVYGTLLKDLRLIKTGVGAQNQSSYVLNKLVEEAKKEELGIGAITALDEMNLEGYTELPFEISVTGKFASLIKYLHALETENLILEVRKVVAENESLNHSVVKAKIEISVYVPSTVKIKSKLDSISQSNQSLEK